MKLDLLYEFQPKIGPYPEPFPHGQKKAEQQTGVGHRAFHPERAARLRRAGGRPVA
ncbi:hypothetical protein MXD61_24980 [Frankia sp. AgPm24]|uniref:hypothetical protein n=1 Tax=Frankia sp. AgPm24 TaxID=631128 RepID=UPI00200E6506|nr:hypothetical protein [Frankia sp. AgPm24]MCK9925082.1 hypothetical protein [Frankia sp. AgPm24]